MMREPRRRSPESSRRRRAERRRSRERLASASAQAAVAVPDATASQPRRRSRADSSTSSSSTSSSLLNISRKGRFGIRSFFASSSVKKVKRRRSFRNKNSSSSSVDSDLAYGAGYVSRSSLERQHAQSAYPQPRQEEPLFGPDGRPALHRAQTDEEIIALGRKLSDLARAENIRDLERAGKKRPSRMATAAAALSQLHHQSSHGSRGLGSSKPHDDGSDGDSDWESASDSDSDSGLAYGSMPKFSDPHLPIVADPSHGERPRAPTIISQAPPEAIRPPNRKSSAVDPAMFGPVNSLRGFVNTPCGFRADEYPPHRARAPQEPIPQPSSASIEARPMQHVYPVPTADASRFEAAASSPGVSVPLAAAPAPSTPTRHRDGDRDRDRDRDSVAYAHSRPDPVPIQAPKPRVPVSPRVLDPEQRLVLERDQQQHEVHRGSPRERRSRKERDGGRSTVDTAVSGALPAIVGAAAGGAAVLAGAAEGRRGRDERREYDDRRSRQRHGDGKGGVVDTAAVGGSASAAAPSREKRGDRRDDRYEGRDRDHQTYDRRDEGRDHVRDLEERRSRPVADGRSGIVETAAAGAAPALIAAAGAAALSDYKSQRELDELREKEARVREERLRYEREAQRHREAREYREQEDERRRREEGGEEEEEKKKERRRGEEQELMDKYERWAREEREIRYKEERRTQDERQRAERDRIAREAEKKRHREEKQKVEARDDKSRERESADHHRSRETVRVVDDRESSSANKEALSRAEEKKPQALAPTAPKPSREERRAKREETRRMILEIERQIELEKKRLAELDAGLAPLVEGRGDTASSSSTRKDAPIDPFQFQVADDAFQTPQYSTPKRPLTPIIQTIEPPWASLQAEPDEELEERLSRRDSFEQELRDAQSIVEETNHSTIPAEPGIIAAVIAVVERQQRSRSRSRGPGRGRDPEPVRDVVQEEANRHYREKKIAEKIAEEQSRSRSASPSPSVVDKYDGDQEPIIRIVTPPEMMRPPKKSKYDAPNADVRIDNVIMPYDIVRFRAPPPDASSLGPATVPVFKSRDPSCERERPMLNLVLPTPRASPSPEKMKAKHATAVDAANETPPEKKDDRKPNVIINARGEAVEAPEDSAAGRAVEADNHDSSQEPPAAKVRSGGKKKNALSMIAAAVAGASAAAAKSREKKQADAEKAARVEGTEVAEAQKYEQEPRHAEHVSKPKAEQEPEAGSRTRAEVEETILREAQPKPGPAQERVREPTRETVSEQAQVPRRGSVSVSEPTDSRRQSTPPRRPVPLDLDDEPPQVGPKPPSPRTVQMPGAFGDDIDFTATLAAGLQTSGFDPNLVIDDPTYRRRDSPPGSNEPFYVPPSAETVTDLDFEPSPRVTVAGVSESPVLERVASTDDWELKSSPGRKGRKKRHSVDVVEVTPGSRENAGERGAAKAVARSEDSWARSPQPRLEGLAEAGEDEWVETLSRKAKDPSPAWFDAEESIPASRDKMSPQTTEAVAIKEGDQALVGADDEWATTSSKKSKRKSKRDSSSYDTTTYSAASSEVSVASSSSRKSKKNRRRSTKDDYDIPEQDEPPDRPRDFFPLKDHEVSSVVSDPSNKRDASRPDGDDAKSIVSLPAASSQPTNGASEHQQPSITENGNKGDSFLGNAGTFGAGAGLAGAVAAMAAQLSRPNATQATAEESPRRERSVSYSSSTVDPEVVQREIKPAIDPQYGDLLPLPPSEPGSPDFKLEEDFPILPESEEDAPPESRPRRSTMTHVRRRSAIETPKTPTRTAVPVQFLLGRGPVPPSPAFRFSSPSQSPVTPALDTPPKNRSRPTSWDSSREIKPLYLLEKASSSAQSAAAVVTPQDYPALPPSDPPSRESPGPEFEARDADVDYLSRGAIGSDLLQALRIDTAMAGEIRFGDPLGSEETTPRAIAAPALETPPFAGGADDEQGRPVEHAEALPPLPESTAALLSQGPSSQVSSPEPVAQLKQLSERDLEQLPHLPESRSESPALPPSPQTSTRPLVEDLKKLPALPRSQPGSPVLDALPLASPQLAVDEVMQLPPLPESRPTSPSTQGALTSVARSEDLTGMKLTDESNAKVVPAVQGQVFAQDLEKLPPLPESRPSSPTQLVSSTAGASQAGVLSPPPGRVLDRQRPTDVANNAKSAALLVSTTAAAGAAAASGLIAAHMRRDSSQPDLPGLESDELQTPSHDMAESVYSLNEDASTIAASAAPTYLSGSTFYETQQETTDSPLLRDSVSFLVGKRAQTASVQDDWVLADAPSPSGRGKKKKKGSQSLEAKPRVPHEPELEPEMRATDAAGDTSAVQAQVSTGKPSLPVKEKQEVEELRPESSDDLSRGKGKKIGKKDASWVEPEPENQHRRQPLSTGHRDNATDDLLQSVTPEQPSSDSVELPEASAVLSTSGKKGKKKAKQSGASSEHKDEPQLPASVSAAEDVAESGSADNISDLVREFPPTPPLQEASPEDSTPAEAAKEKKGILRSSLSILPSIAGGVSSFLGFRKRDDSNQAEQRPAEDGKAQDLAQSGASRDALLTQGDGDAISSENQEQQKQQQGSVEPLQMPKPPRQPPVLGGSSGQISNVEPAAGAHEATEQDKSVGDTASSALDTAVWLVPNEQAPAPEGPTPDPVGSAPPSEAARLDAAAGTLDEPRTAWEGEELDKNARGSPDQSLAFATLDDTQQQQQQQQQPVDSPVAADAGDEPTGTMGKKSKKQQRRDTPQGPAQDATASPVPPEIVDEADQRDAVSEPQAHPELAEAAASVPSSVANQDPTDDFWAEPAGKKGKKGKGKKKLAATDIDETAGVEPAAPEETPPLAATEGQQPSIGVEVTEGSPADTPRETIPPEPTSSGKKGKKDKKKKKQGSQDASGDLGEVAAEKSAPETVDKFNVETSPEQATAESAYDDVRPDPSVSGKEAKEAALSVEDLPQPVQESEETRPPVEEPTTSQAEVSPRSEELFEPSPSSKKSKKDKKKRGSKSADAETPAQPCASENETPVVATDALLSPEPAPLEMTAQHEQSVSADQDSEDVFVSVQNDKEKKKKRQTVTFAEPLEEHLGSTTHQSTPRGEGNSQTTTATTTDPADSVSEVLAPADASVDEQTPALAAQGASGEVGVTVPLSITPDFAGAELTTELPRQESADQLASQPPDQPAEHDDASPEVAARQGSQQTPLSDEPQPQLTEPGKECADDKPSIGDASGQLETPVSFKTSKKDRKKKRMTLSETEAEQVTTQPTQESLPGDGADDNVASVVLAPPETSGSTTEPVTSGAANTEPEPIITAAPFSGQQQQEPPATTEPEPTQTQSQKDKKTPKSKTSRHGSDLGSTTESVSGTSTSQVAVDEVQSPAQPLESESPSQPQEQTAAPEVSVFDATRSPTSPTDTPGEAQPTTLHELSSPSDPESQPESASQDMARQSEEERSPYSLLNKTKKKRKKPKADAEPWPLGSPELDRHEPEIPFETREIERMLIQLSTVDEETEPPTEYAESDGRSLVSENDAQSLRQRKSTVSDSSRTISSLPESEAAVTTAPAQDDGDADEGSHAYSLKKGAGKKEKKDRKKRRSSVWDEPWPSSEASGAEEVVETPVEGKNKAVDELAGHGEAVDGDQAFGGKAGASQDVGAIEESRAEKDSPEEDIPSQDPQLVQETVTESVAERIAQEAAKTVAEQAAQSPSDENINPRVIEEPGPIKVSEASQQSQEPEEQVEPTEIVVGKRSKKDKKKRASQVLESQPELEPAAQRPSPAAEDLPTETASREPISTGAREPDEHAADEPVSEAVPTRKSKKDKKAKKASKEQSESDSHPAVADVPVSEETAPAAESAPPVEEATRVEEAAPAQEPHRGEELSPLEPGEPVHFEEPVTAEDPLAARRSEEQAHAQTEGDPAKPSDDGSSRVADLQPEASAQLKTEAEAEEFFPLTRKKSKKDKKKKGASQPEQEPADRTPVEEPNIDTSAENQELTRESEELALEAARDIAQLASEPSQSQSAESEELFAAPAKKSKKDKKKKGKAAKAAEPEAASSGAAAPVEESTPAAQEAAAAEKQPGAVVDEPRRAEEEASPIAEAAIISIQEPGQQAEQPSSGSVAESAGEPPSVLDEAALIVDEPAPVVEQPSSGPQEAHASVTEEATPMPGPEAQPEETWDEPTRKGKKDRKKKKGKGSQIIDSGPRVEPAPAIFPSEEQPAVTEDPSSVVEEPLPAAEGGSSDAGDAISVVREPEEITPAAAQDTSPAPEPLEKEVPREESWEPPTKAKKKGKKSRGSKVLFEPEPELAADTKTEPASGAMSVPAEEPSSGAQESSAPAEGPGVSVEEPGTRDLPEETPPVPETPQQESKAEDDEWAAPAKKSKKDKKGKKGKAKALEPEPELQPTFDVPPASVGEPDPVLAEPSVPGGEPRVIVQEPDVVTEPSAAAQEPEPESAQLEPDADKERAEPVKKSKKGKKKDKGAKAAEPEPALSELPAPAEHESLVTDEPGSKLEQLEKSETAQAPEHEPLAEALVEPTTTDQPAAVVSEEAETTEPMVETQPEDDWDLPVKKSKKEKKKKGKGSKAAESEQSSLGTPAVVEESCPVVEEPVSRELAVVSPEEPPAKVLEQASPAVGEEPAPIPDTSEQPSSAAVGETTPETLQEQPEEIRDLPFKKSKKDKKGKKKGSKAVESGSSSGPVTPPAEESVLVPEEPVASQEVVIETPHPPVEAAAQQPPPEPHVEITPEQDFAEITVEEALPAASLPQDVQIDETFERPAKKKKAKKGKPGIPEPVATPDASGLAIEEQLAPVAPETREVFNAEASSSIQEPVAGVTENEPEPSLEEPRAADLWDQPSKKSRKDKKKKGPKVSDPALASGSLTPVLASVAPQESALVLEEDSSTQEPVSEPTEEPQTTSHDDQQLPSESAPLSLSPEQEPPLATDVSVSEPPEKPERTPAEKPPPMVLEHSEHKKEPEETATETPEAAQPEPQADDLWDTPAKKGKKEKKKKKGKVKATKPELEPETPSVPESEAAKPASGSPDVERDTDAQVSLVVAEDAQSTEASESLENAPEAAQPEAHPEALLDVTAKQGKKDKKKDEKESKGQEKPVPEPQAEVVPDPTPELERGPEADQPVTPHPEISDPGDPQMPVSVAAEEASSSSQEPVPSAEAPDALQGQASGKPPEEAPGDVWPAPVAKKGKKDKKKKGKGKVFEAEPEPEPVPESAAASAAEQTPELELDSGLATVNVVESEASAAVAEEEPPSSTAQSNQQLTSEATDIQWKDLDIAAEQPQSETAWDVPTKKGKKKKGKGKTAELQPEPEPEVASEAPCEHTVVAEPAIVSERLITEPEATVITAAAEDEPITSTDVPSPAIGLEATDSQARVRDGTPEQQADDSWGFPAKKGKKNKVVEPEPEAPLTAEAPAAEVPTSVAVEAEPQTLAGVALAPDIAISTETAPDSAKEAITGTVSESVAESVGKALPEAGAEPVIEDVMEEAIPESSTEAATERAAEWTSPAKKSKKDKKRKGSIKQAESEAAPEVLAARPAQEETSTPLTAHLEAATESTDREAPADKAEADDLWAEPAKSSKKAKKKSKQAVGLDSVAGVPGATTEPVLDVTEPRDVSLDEDEAVFGGPSREDSESARVKETEPELPRTEQARKGKKRGKKVALESREFEASAPTAVEAETPAAPVLVNDEEQTVREVVEVPSDVQESRDVTSADVAPGEATKDEEPAEFSSVKKSKKDKKKKARKSDLAVDSGPDVLQGGQEKSTADILPAAVLAAAVATSAAAAALGDNDSPASKEAGEEDFSFVSKKSKKDKKKKGKGAAVVAEEEQVVPSVAETSREDQSPWDDSGKQPELVEVVPPGGAEEIAGGIGPENKSSSRSQTPVAGKAELHPAVSEVLGKSPIIGQAPATVGLGLIANPPEPYPEDAPSPKLLTALESAAAGQPGRVDLAPAQETSYISHEPPFDYVAHRKKIKTGEGERTEMPEPVATDGEVDASFAKDKDRGEEKKEKGKAEEDAAIVAAASALTGGVALLAEKFGGAKKRSAGRKKPAADKRTAKEEGTFDDTSLWEGAERKSHEGPRMDVGSDKFGERRKEAVSAKRSVEADKQAQTRMGVEGPGLGRMDSETIPRSLRDGSAAGEPSEDKKKERRERSPEPEPVQRAFSFPDDIADEEVFSTRAIEADNNKEQTTTPAADEPVRLPALSNLSEFMRSHSSLPPVQEELSDTDDEPARRQAPAGTHGTRRIPASPEQQRDSGFGSDSPQLPRRIHDDHEAVRDSGVHLRDSTGSRRSLSPRNRIPETPVGDDAERRLPRRSPLRGHPETPRLREPSPPPRTAEPEKLQVHKKRATTAATAPASRTVSVSVADSTHPTPRRVSSNTSMARLRTPEPALRPDSPGSSSIRSLASTPPLRRMDKRASGDLRSVSLSQRDSSQNEQPASQASSIAAAGAAAAAAALLLSSSAHKAPAAAAAAAHSTTPVANEGRVRAKDMTDVYDGYGEGRIGSPRSPTRPHSMRRRQSMQVLELESRVEQLLAENRLLTEARAQAETSLGQRNASAVAERDAEIESLKRMLQEANQVIERLKQTNEGLRSSTSAIAVKHHEEVRRLETENAQTAKELELARDAAVQHARAVQDKDAEIAQLRVQLEAIKEQIRELQQQILDQARPSDDPDFLDMHDIDYFDHRCQQLCAHVQQWVLRFSKFSDMRACRLTSELSDEKLIDRLDNAVLDGSNVDTYLNDRVRRRDIFMSMTMTMIWEFVFTRYLFGMDREQRQKLKHLEKQLVEVGPPHAVRQWRAVTLTLLSRRPAFKKQRDQDTEAVVQAILDTLSKILPPPSHLEDQIQAQLRRVVREAVGLAVEMRCQRAEYMMLPPLQPEYDDTGELTETVAFNAALMNSSSSSSEGGPSNEDLERAGATVRVVLFPLVLRKGDDAGRGDDEIVVTPAQVLVASPNHGGAGVSRRGSATPSAAGGVGDGGDGGTGLAADRSKNVRLMTPSSDAGGASLLARSTGGEKSPRQGPSRSGRAQSDVSMGEAGGYL